MRKLNEITKEIAAKEIEVKEAQFKVDEFKEALEAFDKSEAADTDQYDEMLDEQGEIGVAGMSYATSQVLKAVDPVAYRCGFNDWVDSLDNEEFPEYIEMRDELEEAEDELSDLENELEELEDERDEAESDEE